MKKVLILGAGHVANPLVRHLIQEGFYVKIASKVFTEECEELAATATNCETVSFEMNEETKLEELIQSCDLTVSLLPYAFHPKIASLCIRYKKDMVTASYVSEQMKALDEDAREAGILILNEVGLDPGIDHMSAMKVIDEVHGLGGKVLEFKSYCGGLPAMQNNNNPFGYKFSWSPRGVVMAGRNNGQFLENRRVVFIPARDLFKNYCILDIEDIATFEAYTNRDALPYKEIYGLKEAHTVFRGTLRNVGWCYKMKKAQELGLFDDSKRRDLKGLTYRRLMLKLIDKKESNDIIYDTANFLRLERYSTVMKRFQWLGLFEENPLPPEDNVMDMFCALLQEKLAMAKDDLDLIVLHHRFVAMYPDRCEEITSTLEQTGTPGGDSAMAKCVGLPAAIASAMILQGETSIKGVQLPVKQEIYKPILEKLQALNIHFKETTTPCPPPPQDSTCVLD